MVPHREHSDTHVGLVLLFGEVNTFTSRMVQKIKSPFGKKAGIAINQHDLYTNSFFIVISELR